MRLVRDWPFKSERLELTATEKATLKRAADIAERAAGYFEPESCAWEDWKRLECAARESADDGR